MRLSPEWDIKGNCKLPAGSSPSPTSTCYRSPKFDEPGSESGDQPTPPSTVPPTHGVTGVKCKSITDSLTETTALERESRLQMVAAQIAAKNHRLSQAVQGKLEQEALKQDRLE